MVDDHVMVKNHTQGPDWVPAYITEQTGPV